MRGYFTPRFKLVMNETETQCPTRSRSIRPAVFENTSAARSFFTVDVTLRERFRHVDEMARHLCFHFRWKGRTTGLNVARLSIVVGQLGS